MRLLGKPSRCSGAGANFPGGGNRPIAEILKAEIPRGDLDDRRVGAAFTGIGHRDRSREAPSSRFSGHACLQKLVRAREQATALRELAEIVRVKFMSTGEAPEPPGGSIHECGTARMGTDPSNSVLDPFHEGWEARGLYITDAASFPSQGAANPTLTILALTARACEHAIRTNRG